MFTSRSQNGQVSGGRTYPPGLFPTGGIAILLFAQATTTSTQPTTTTTTTTTATTTATTATTTATTTSIDTATDTTAKNGSM